MKTKTPAHTCGEEWGPHNTSDAVYNLGVYVGIGAHTVSTCGYQTHVGVLYTTHARTCTHTITHVSIPPRIIIQNHAMYYLNYHTSSYTTHHHTQHIIIHNTPLVWLLFVQS